jgi:hypothetical protein
MNEELQVPGEPGVYFCARHKHVKTRLRCGRCETPICPKCTTYGPTGARCKTCVSNRTSHMCQVAPRQFLAAFGVAFASSALAALLASFIPFFVMLYALVAGTLIGKAIVRVVGGKRGVPLAIVASLGIAAGALLPFGGGSSFFSIYLWAYIALAISGVWYWLK